MKLKVFVLNVFYGRNAIPRADSSYGTVPRAPRSDGKTFFVLLLYFAGRCCQNLHSARGSAQCKSGPGNNMVSKRNNLLYYFSIGIIHLHLASFLCDEILSFEKKLAGEMLIEQINEFGLRGLGPWSYLHSYNWLFL